MPQLKNDRERFVWALPRLSPARCDDRDSWLKVLMVAHKIEHTTTQNVDDVDLLDAVIEWSQQSDKYVEGDCERLWAGFDHTRENTVGVGTIMAWALQDADTLPANGNDTKRPLPPAPSQSPHESLNSLIASVGRNAGQEAGRWTYHDAKSREVCCIVRFQKGDKKTYRPFKSVNGGWASEGIDSNRPLYRLSELSAAKRVLVVEGEKCADALRELGFTATTSMHGAQSPAKSDWSVLANSEVVILPDADAAGRKYARTVSSLIANMGGDATIRTVELPDLPEKGDVVDFIAAREGMTADAIRSEIETLIDGMPAENAADLCDGLVLEWACDIEPEPVEWTWEKKIPLGMVTILAGDGGVGKSFLAADFAARVSTGTAWPDGKPCQQGTVVIFSAEESAKYGIVPRLQAAGADRRHVAVVRKVKRQGKDGLLNLQKDIAYLDKLIRVRSDLRVVIFDPINDYLGSADNNSNAEVREALLPLVEWAERNRVAVICHVHINKDEKKSARHRVNGSGAFRNVARALWFISDDSQDLDHKRKLFVLDKSNYGPSRGGFAWTLDESGLVPHVQWLEAVDMSSNEALATPDRREGHSTVANAQAWLDGLLGEKGPMPASDVFEQGLKIGFSKSTLRKAADALGVKKTKAGFDGGWIWAHPCEMTEDGEQQ